MKKFVLILAFLLTYSSSFIFSQTWKRIDGLYGASVQSLSYNKGIATIGTKSGFYLSFDNGLTWNLIDSSDHYGMSTYKAVALSPNNILFNASSLFNRYNGKMEKTKYNKFHVTKDGNVLVSEYGLYNDKDELIQSFPNAFDFIIEANKFLLLKYSQNEKNVFKYISSNNGKTWKSINNTLIQNILVDENNTFYAFNYGVFTSVDTCRVWEPTSFTNTQVYGTIYMGNGIFVISTDFGIFRSEDYCANWELVSKSKPRLDVMVKTDNGTILGIYYGQNSVYRSTDLGSTWTQESLGLTNTYIYDLYANSDGRIITNYYNSFIMSNTEQNKWNDKFDDSISFSNDKRFYNNSFNNKLYFKDDLNVYEADLQNNELSFRFKANSNLLFEKDTIYYLYNGLLYHKIDTNSPKSISYLALFNQPTCFKYKDRIFCTAIRNQTFVFYPYQDTLYMHKGEFKYPENCTNPIVIVDDRFIMINEKHSISSSNDEGYYWKVNSIGLPSDVWVNTLYLAKNQILYAGTDYGIYKADTRNDNLMWTRLNTTALTNLRINAITSDDDGNLYVGTDGGGIFRLDANPNDILSPILKSPSNGTINLNNPVTLTWESITEANYYHLQVATNPLFYNKTLVYNDTSITNTSFTSNELKENTTYYWRVRAIKNSNAISNWSSRWSFKMFDPLFVYESSTFSITPNPSKDFITLTNFENEIIDRISIINMLGEEFKVQTNGNKIDISQLSSGVYNLIFYANGKIHKHQFIKI